ncbi:MAG: hypothetical protein JWO20_3227 [Candidatus Angelobacter sp.]|nr:hypothetical protein [Candidatus Angelobacter sp.]
MSALIVDVPMRMAVVADEERCIHVRSGGARCESARIERSERCAIHHEWFNSHAAAMGLQFPEDAISLHRMLGAVLGMVVSGRVGYKSARSVVELCKMMQNNVRAYEEEVREVERDFRLGKRSSSQ